MNLTCRTFFLCICIPSLAFAGAWTREKGSLQIISSATISHANQFYDTSGKRIAQPLFTKQEISTYLEYGAKDALTVGGQWSITRAIQAGNSNRNLGDAELFARLRVWENDRAVWSLQPYVIVPSPDATTDIPKIGSDHFSYGLKSSYGFNYSAFGRKHYSDLAASYLYRAGTPNDQLRFEATTELSLNPLWSIMPQMFYTHTRKTKWNTTFQQASGDDYTALTTQLSVLFRMHEKTKVQLAAFTTPRGENASISQGFKLSYWTEF